MKNKRGGINDDAGSLQTPVTGRAVNVSVRPDSAAGQ